MSRALIFSLVVILLTGCQRVPVKRTYHEVVESAPPTAESTGFVHPSTPMSGELDISAIPDDDIHAFLREGKAMPASGEARQGRPMTGAMDPETQKMLEASAARPPLSWTTPPGWQETKGSGMRLVSFAAGEKDDAVECTIISLGGQAGGLESNVVRWMKQVNIPEPEESELKKFFGRQKKIRTRGGFEATIIDLTQLQASKDLQSPSMIAAIIELPETTVFIKLTGSRGAVVKNKDKFETLCESLKLN